MHVCHQSVSNFHTYPVFFLSTASPLIPATSLSPGYSVSTLNSPQSILHLASRVSFIKCASHHVIPRIKLPVAHITPLIKTYIFPMT